MDPLVGRTLDGRYLVSEELARGGMATVYRGLDTRLNRVVALKVMSPAFASDADFVRRFTHEAQASAGLNDTHVVSVFDQGDDDGVVFLVMEYVSGQTLRDVLRTRQRLTPDEALDIFEPMLQALAAAHRAHIVHRDVKPENVLIRDDGVVKVADFGLARAATEGAPTPATQGLLLGTVAYLAPEQVQHGSIDTRTDVYAAGILLYEMLVGSPPYSGDTAWDVASQHVNQTVPPPSLRVPSLPSGLDHLVLQATSADPDARPADAGVFLSQVKAVRARIGVAPLATAVPADLQQTAVVRRPDLNDTSVVVAPAAVASASGAGGSSEAKPQKQRRWRGPVALAVVVALAIAIGSVAWWLGSGRYTTVPGVIGVTSKQAEAKLQEAGLGVAYDDPQYSEIVSKGLVLSSDPAPGGRVARNGAVTLVLSLGPERYDVPKLVNLTQAQAQEALTKTKLAVGTVKRQYSETVPNGRVISSSPAAGTSVRVGTAVDLVVSKGLPPVTVPDVTNKPYDEAQRTLESLGLTISQSDQKYSEQVAKGSIITQSPAPGANVTRGTAVNVVVSLGPPLVTVPNVVDDPVDTATAKLEAAGFKVEVYEPFGISPLNRVASQDPKAGTQAPKGSVVRIGII